MMRLTILIVTSAALLGAVHGGAAADTPSAKQRETLKERLSDKASDEQRVNDCKVPPERRSAKSRPVDCPRDADRGAPSGQAPRATPR